MTRRLDPKVVVIAVLAFASVVTGILLPATSHGSSNPSTADVIAADPPPTLFPATDTAQIDRIVGRQRPLAVARIREWAAAHGTRPDDRAFVQWVEAGFPPPPADLMSEMPRVVALDRQRTAAGVHAATWLETHGKKDVWKLYAHDQREWLAPHAEKALKADEKDLLSMAKTLSDTLGARFGSSAPYVRQPSLRTDHKVAPGQKGRVGDPARRAAAAPGRAVPVPRGRDRLLPRLHGRALPERHRGGCVPRRPDRRLLPDHPGGRGPGVAHLSGTNR